MSENLASFASSWPNRQKSKATSVARTRVGEVAAGTFEGRGRSHKVPWLLGTRQSGPSVLPVRWGRCVADVFSSSRNAAGQASLRVN